MSETVAKNGQLSTKQHKAIEALLTGQTKGQADQVPVVLHRPNRRPWVCCFYLDDLLAFVDVVEDIRGTEASN